MWNEQMVQAYKAFVPARHSIWEARQRGASAHLWTFDPILQERKFTNVYRVLDPGSQYLLRMMQEPGITKEDALARAYLYRMTNRPETWDHMRAQLGRWPLATDLGPQLEDLLVAYRDAGNQVFSGAYIIMPRPGVSGDDKARSVVQLAAQSFHPDSPVGYAFTQTRSMADRYHLLHSQQGIGPFIAMQVLTDYGYYSGDQDENSFVVPGPGARNGAKELNPALPAKDVLQWAAEQVWQHNSPVLYGRKPSLMDIQNTLCEFSKYARYMRKPRTGKPYRPAHPGVQPKPLLPTYWLDS